MRLVNFIDQKNEMIQIFAKAWTDELFKQRLLNNPKEVLSEFDISMDKKMKIHLHLDSQEHFFINFPLKPTEAELSEEQLKLIVGGLSDDATLGVIVGSIAGSYGGVMAASAAL